MEIEIRLEKKSDHRTVEELTKKAFWNQYMPGGDEHYLVHLFRNSTDFIAELTFVALLDGQIVGHILFTHSYIQDTVGAQHPVITFGPLSVLPEYQNKGIGAALIKHSAQKAKELGYKAIVIYGYPAYYSRFGFKAGMEYAISDPDGKYPVANLALELQKNALSGIAGKFMQSSLFDSDPAEVAAFDRDFPFMEKKVTESQALFEKTCQMFHEVP